MTAQKKKRLGEILIDQGIITNADLERALAKQKKEGGLFGEVLLRMGLVKEEDIVIALAQQFNIPYLPIQNCNINSKLLKLIPIELIRKYWVIPIDRIKDVITVIMVDPLNEYAKKDIAEVTGCRVQALVGTVSEMTAAIKRYYKIKDALVDHISQQDKIAKMSFHEASSERKKDDDAEKKDKG